MILMEARCCKTWPILAPAPLGECGLCGKRPTIVGPWKER